MTRFKLTLEYDGGGFVGWQRQDNGLGVQQVVEEAFKKFCGERVVTHVAGRTDAGVHATGQVCHADIEKETDADTVRDALNYHVKPHAISVLNVGIVSDEFHARFAAKSRAYTYRILNRRPPPAIEREHVWWVPQPLDAEAMNEAAAGLIGHHDFSSFRAAGCQADSPVKTLDVLTVERQGEEVIVRARARSFLYHQVRNMVGTLRQVGEGKWTAADVLAALAAKDRAEGGPTAPPEGLYLTAVEY